MNAEDDCHDRKMTEDDSAPAGDQDSEGQGLCYCLALFLAHEGSFRSCLAEVELMAVEGAIRFEGRLESDEKAIDETLGRLAAVRWFTQAARPLRNLVIDSDMPAELQQRLKKLENQCLRWSLPNEPRDQPGKADVRWALEEAKELLRVIDEFHGIQTVRESRDAMAKRSPCLVFRGW